MVADRPFVVMVVWLVLAFLLGGSSRADVASLGILRSIAAIVLAYAMATVSLARLRENRMILGVAVAITALPALQLVPLPPAVWHGLPGRGIIADIDREAGLGDIWRPLSMSPAMTWNALWSLLVPWATLLLGIRLDREQRHRLVSVVLVIGLASALLGLMQTLGDPKGALYFYGITSNGMPVGFFANRNHQAVFLVCILLALAIWARRGGFSARAGRGDAGRRGRALYPAIAGAAFILPLIFITGSRSGLVLAVLAIAAMPLMLWRGGGAERRAARSEAGRSRLPGSVWLWALPLALAMLAVMTVQMGRGISLDRLMGQDIAQDMRALILPTVLDMVRAYMPWGTGFGSFEDVYRVHEARELLRPFYMNHAHNDWLELALTGGIPALVLLVAMLAALALRAARVLLSGWRGDRGESLARLGLMVLVILGLASLTDYPLRVPSLACFAVIAVLWLWVGSEGKSLRRGVSR